MLVSELILRLSQHQAQYGDSTVVIPKYTAPRGKKDNATAFAMLKAVSASCEDETDADTETQESAYVILSSKAISCEDKFDVESHYEWDNVGKNEEEENEVS